MLSDKLQAALNHQINEEFYSSYLYLSMAGWFEDKNLDGCAHWMQMQAEEEWQHGMKLFRYLVDRGGRVALKEIKAPPTNWDTPRAAFEAALAHEQFMTRNINVLAELSINEKDYATNNVMQWYIAEQVEEEASVDDILKKLALMGDTGTGLFMMDRELKARPAPAAMPAE